MAQVYFHCSNTREVLIDRRGTAVCDMAEARDYAIRVVRSLVMAPNSKDWRGWVLGASDDLGAEIFMIPFEVVLGKPH
jgi:hypothetical protein